MTRCLFKNFWVAGHTYGSTDQAFGRYAAGLDTVYTPMEWFQHAGLGAKSVHVVEVVQAFFRDCRQHLWKVYTEETKSKILDFQNVVWFNFGKGEKEVNGKLDNATEVWVRYTYSVKD